MKRQSWLQLTAVQVGGAICLPVIMVGQMLGEKFGLVAAATAVVAGNLLLALLGLGVASMATRYRESTPQVAARFLGKRGGQMLAVTLMVTMVGWFAIQLNLMGLSLAQLLGLAIPPWVYNLGLGAVMTGAALFGLRSIAALALVATPILLGTMGGAAYLVADRPSLAAESFSLLGISVVMSAAVGAVFDLPTFFRNARSRKGALTSVAIAFGLALPLVEMLGVYIGIKTPGEDLLAALMGAGGALWGVWVVLFLLLAGWTTNNANLYSASTCLETLTPKVSERRRNLLVGLVATGLSCLPLLAHFELVLGVMGSGVTLVGTLVLVCYFKEVRNEKVKRV